jgi:hypothetical protein
MPEIMLKHQKSMEVSIQALAVLLLGNEVPVSLNHPLAKCDINGILDAAISGEEPKNWVSHLAAIFFGYTVLIYKMAATYILATGGHPADWDFNKEDPESLHNLYATLNLNTSLDMDSLFSNTCFASLMKKAPDHMRAYAEVMNDYIEGFDAMIFGPAPDEEEEYDLKSE